MKNNNTIWVIIVLIIIVGGYFLLKGKTTPSESGQKDTETMDMEQNQAPELTAEQQAQLDASNSAHSPQTLTFDVNGGSFYFKPNEIHVKLGDTVKINFKNDGGFHDFKIDEFNVATKQIKTGETDTVTFVANKKGTFQYYCSVGNHRANGMKGSLIVE